MKINALEVSHVWLTRIVIVPNRKLRDVWVEILYSEFKYSMRLKIVDDRFDYIMMSTYPLNQTRIYSKME